MLCARPRGLRDRLNYRFKRADRVTIIWGRYAGRTGTVDANVLQRTKDYSDESRLATT